MAVWPRAVYRRPMRRAAAVVMVALVATTLVGCGDDEVCSRPDGSGCYPDPDPSGQEPNDADEDFVLDHALSVGEVGNLAELAADTSDDPAVVELADAYAEETDELLDTFGDLEEAWDLEPPVYDGTPGGRSAAVPQYAGDDDYFVLEDLSGEEFDAYWVEVMLERADEQVRATEDLLEDGAHPGLRDAAETWIGANEALIAGLEDLERDLAP